MILIPSHLRSFISIAAAVASITVSYAVAGTVSTGSIVLGNHGTGGIATRAAARLDDKTQASMSVLQSGRTAYAAGKYEDALKDYQSALQLMPIAPATEKRRKFIQSSIADASVAVAQDYAKVGRYDEARTLLNDALKTMPDSKLVKRSLDYLDDPIRNNPAKTPQNAKNVQEVERLLIMGNGFYDLGQYDDAIKSFQEALKIDPYNTSARSGMERVDRRRNAYAQSAYDQTRGKALSDVSSQWEQPVLGEELPAGAGDASSPVDGDFGIRSIETKLSSIILPRVDLENVDLMEAVDFLRHQSIALDKQASIESERGVNITVNLGSPDSENTKKILSKRFNLKLSNMPLKQVLDYVAKATGTDVRSNAYTVELMSAGDSSGVLVSKVLPLPPGFFSSLGNNDASSQAEADPFAETSSSASSISIKRVDPKIALKALGVDFPAGSSVRYNADKSTLFVHNTSSNIRKIEDMIQAQSTKQPVQVVVKATFIEVSEKTLKELGFDWIINSNITTDKLYGGGGGDKLNPLNDGIYSGVAKIADAAVPTGVVTGGLRSMDKVQSTDNIDSLIENGSVGSRGAGYQPGSAPSFFTLRGVWKSVDLAFVMKGLNQNTGADVLQKPQLIVRPGESASFYSGREMSYPESYEAPQLPTSSDSSGGIMTPSHPSTFAVRETGTLFDVEVTGLSEDKSIINLTLKPQIVEFDGFINYGSVMTIPVIGGSNNNAVERVAKVGSGADIYNVEISSNKILQPIFSVKKETTSVSIATGSTVVLGALKKSRNVAFEDKIPILGDIPLVGRMFRSEGTQVERTLLLIMVRADVVDPAGKDLYRSTTPDAPPEAKEDSPIIPPEAVTVDAGMPME
ncbi:MAG: Amuc_1098 family type IV pilus outer membrane protein [Akkermansia sp.]